MRNAPSAWLPFTLIISFLCQSALAKDINCDEQSKKGDICLCKIFDLHPTQASVGMAEVRIKAEKLKNEIQRRSELDFADFSPPASDAGPKDRRFCDDVHRLFDGSCSASKGAERRPSFFPE